MKSFEAMLWAFTRIKDGRRRRFEMGYKLKKR
jgi:hypothetical protein